MDGSSEIHAETQRMINAIKTAPVYSRYRAAIASLDKYPGVFDRIMELRTETIRLYNDSEATDVMESSERLSRQYEELQKYPEVNEFLEAEEDLVHILKSAMREVAGSLDLHVPDI